MSQYTLNPPIRNNFYAGARTTGRIYVRPSVYLPDSEVDPQTGMLKDAERRVGRTQAMRLESRALDSEYARLQTMLQARADEKGKRMSLKAAILLIATAVVFFSIILLFQQGNIVAREENIRQTNVKILNTQNTISNISAQIAEASDPVAICYAAARDLDMVPAESAQAIYLTALNTRPGQAPIAIRASSD